MNLFSGFIILLTILVLFKNRNVQNQYIDFLSLLIFFELFINVGYFTKIGGYEFTFSDFYLLIVMLYTVYFLLKVKYKLNDIFVGFALITSVIISVSLLGVHPLNKLILRNLEYVMPELSLYSLIITFRFIIIVFIAIIWKYKVDFLSLERIILNIQKFSNYIIALLLIEFITKNIFHSNIFMDIVSQLFGVGESTVSFIFKRGNLYVLQGLTREPSHLALGLFYLALILIFSNRYKNTLIRVIIISIILFVSGSFSAVLYISAIVSVFFLRYYKKKEFLLIIPILVILAAVFLQLQIASVYFGRILNSIQFFTNLNYGSRNVLTSETIRFTSIVESLNIFMDRFFFGIGLGIPYSFGFVSGALSSIGIIGFILWVKYVFFTIGNNSNKSIKYILTLLIVWFFVGNVNILYNVTTILLSSILGYENRLNRLVTLETKS